MDNADTDTDAKADSDAAALGFASRFARNPAVCYAGNAPFQTSAMAFPRNPNRKLDKADLMIALPEIVIAMMALGLLSAALLPDWIGGYTIWLFLLPFLLLAVVLVLAALGGVLGRLFR